jgi:hypothetical protein
MAVARHMYFGPALVAELPGDSGGKADGTLSTFSLRFAVSSCHSLSQDSNLQTQNGNGNGKEDPGVIRVPMIVPSK